MNASVLPAPSGDLFYRHSDGDGPAVVLVHGNSGSSEGFLPLMEGPFGKRRRLIALDLPGHGNSPKAEDPEAAYSPIGFARTVAEFAEELDLRHALWVGHSFGGHVLLNAWEGLPEPAGLAFFGTAPLAFPPDFAAAYPPNPGMALFFAPSTGPGDALKAIGAATAPGRNPDHIAVEDFRRADPESRKLIGESIAAGAGADEIRILGNLGAPVAILHGEHDRFVGYEYLARLPVPGLWGGAVRLFPGAGHFIHRDAPDALADVLGRFADDVFGGFLPAG